MAVQEITEQPPSHAELQQQVLDLRADQDSELHRARRRFQALVCEEIDWWYQQARQIALKGRPSDQIRMLMVKTILDKFLPTKQEFTRGAAVVSGTTVNIKNVNRGTTESVERATRERAAPIPAEFHEANGTPAPGTEPPD